jgi:flagellar protein FliO/FliZ
MEFFQGLFGESGALAAKFVLALVIVLVLIGLVALLVRRISGTHFAFGPKGRQPRLQIMEAAALDPKRRIMLVRRDNVEHLILIGGGNDVLVERNIVKGVGNTLRRPMMRPAPQPLSPLQTANTPHNGVTAPSQRSASAHSDHYDTRHSAESHEADQTAYNHLDEDAYEDSRGGDRAFQTASAQSHPDNTVLPEQNNQVPAPSAKPALSLPNPLKKFSLSRLTQGLQKLAEAKRKSKPASIKKPQTSIAPLKDKTYANPSKAAPTAQDQPKETTPLWLNKIKPSAQPEDHSPDTAGQSRHAIPAHRPEQGQNMPPSSYNEPEEISSNTSRQSQSKAEPSSYSDASSPASPAPVFNAVEDNTVPDMISGASASSDWQEEKEHKQSFEHDFRTSQDLSREKAATSSYEAEKSSMSLDDLAKSYQFRDDDFESPSYADDADALYKPRRKTTYSQAAYDTPAETGKELQDLQKVREKYAAQKTVPAAEEDLYKPADKTASSQSSQENTEKNEDSSSRYQSSSKSSSSAYSSVKRETRPASLTQPSRGPAASASTLALSKDTSVEQKEYAAKSGPDENHDAGEIADEAGEDNNIISLQNKRDETISSSISDQEDDDLSSTIESEMQKVLSEISGSK